MKLKTGYQQRKSKPKGSKIEKISKIDKPLARLTKKKKGGGIQITNI